MEKSQLVKQHLIEHGSLTSMEAIEKYRCTRLAAVIFDLKKGGMNIRTVIHRRGKTSWAQYVLEAA